MSNFLNDHCAFNRFQVLTGIRQAEAGSASAYVLECRFKRIIRTELTGAMLTELSLMRYGPHNRFRLVEKEEILSRITKADSKRIQFLMEMYHKNGIFMAVVHLLHLHYKRGRKSKAA